METTLTQLDSIHLIISILMLSMGIVFLSLAFTLPQQKVTTYSNVIGATLALLSSGLFLSQVFSITIISFSSADTLSAIYIILSIIITIWACFVAYALKPRHERLRWISLTSIIAMIISVSVILSTDIFTISSEEPFLLTLNTIGYILASVAIFYSLIAIYLVWTSWDKWSNLLRFPSLSIAFGYILTLIYPNALISLFLITLSVFGIAFALIRHQLLTPMQNLKNDVSSKNQTLEEQTLDLAHKEAQIQSLSLKLTEANRYKVQFLSNMSHELRTPLNSVIGYSELLLSPIYGELNQQQEDRLDRINRNGKHLAGLIETLLDMSKLVANDLKIKKSELDVQQLVNDLIIRIQPILDEKPFILEQDIPSDLPLLWADAKYVTQILYNLLDNAIKFTHEGSIRLDVMMLSVSEGGSDEFPLPMKGWLKDGEWMLFQVQDTGIGIMEADLRNIFTSFVQLDGSTEREFGGVGVGLSLVEKLVEKHNGMIWVQSELEIGSIFFVAFPQGS